MVTDGLSAAWFVTASLREVTSSWVVARWLQVQFMVSLFPRLKGEVRSHSSSRSCWVANFLPEQRSSVPLLDLSNDH